MSQREAHLDESQKSKFNSKERFLFESFQNLTGSEMYQVLSNRPYNDTFLLIESFEI
jgi:hypothetical protein